MCPSAHGRGRLPWCSSASCSRGTDARLLIACGLAVMAAADYWMVRMNLEVGPWQMVGPRMLLTLGIGLMFADQRGGLQYIPPHIPGGGGWLAQPAAHRGRQRGHLDGFDDSGAAAAVAFVAHRRRVDSRQSTMSSRFCSRLSSRSSNGPATLCVRS